MYPVNIPSSTLCMSKKKNFQQKLEKVWNIPKCDETNRWRQKPEKKVLKKVNPPSICTLHAKKMSKKEDCCETFKFVVKSVEIITDKWKRHRELFFRTWKISKLKSFLKNVFELEVFQQFGACF